MEITLLHFDKRLNSTKQPTAQELAAGKTYNNLTLKELTNIDNPLLKLAGASLNEYAYNYAYISDWGRYYHIKSADLRHEDIYYANLELDDLATYKTQILNTSAFVIYSTSNYNRWIKDDRIPIVARPPETVIAYSNPSIEIGGITYSIFDASFDETIILNAVSLNNGLAHWCITEGALNYIVDALTRAGTSVWQSMQMQFGDAMGSIISLIRLPINFMVMPTTGNSETVYLGDYAVQTGESQYAQETRLDADVLIYKGRCGIPTTYTDFRVFEPYTRLKIRLPFVGLVDISHQDFSGSIYYEFSIDLLTGKIIWTLFNDENHNRAIATYSGQCGSVVPIASMQVQNAYNVLENVAQGIIGVGSSIASGGIGLTSGILSTAAAFYSANDKTASVIGSYNGGRSEFVNKRIEVIAEKYETAEEPANLAAIEGRPLMQYTSLANLTGFVKTQGFSISLDANSSVIRSINAKLDAGIYIE